MLIYSHPDGHQIDFTDNHLTVVSDDGTSVTIPIGALGLRKLSQAADSALTEADTAEQAGHAIGSNCLEGIMGAEDQAQSVEILCEALMGLAKLKHQDRVCAGFAVAIVHTVELGLGVE